MKHISEIIKEGKTAIICTAPEELENAYRMICNINNIERLASDDDIFYKFWDKKLRCIDTANGYIRDTLFFINNGYNTINYREVDFSEIAKANKEDQPKPIEIKEKVIDWEQRRYEIAKDIFSRHLMAKIGEIDTTEKLVSYSVECADKLIKCLKEN